MRRFVLAAAFSIASVSAALADSAEIAVEHAWARPTPASAVNGAAYFTLRNTGKTEDTLTGAETSVTAKAELHESKMNGMVMTMAPLGDVSVPAGGTVSFAPAGKHVMLLGLKAPLLEGQSLILTLLFKNAGKKDVKVDVLSKAPMAMPSGDMGGMDMSH